MATSQNHYEILGVRPDANADTIKRAYYAKMRLYHPDNFIPERRRLEIVNDQTALLKLDKKIDDAKKQTQRLNLAYDILSDVDRRAHYDRQRLTPAAPPPIDPEYYRRTVKSRPHRHSVNTAGKSVEEKFPVAIFMIFIVVTLVISLGLSGLFQFPDDYLALPTADKDRIPVGSVDATATAYARRPTATPRSLDSYVSAGNALFAAGRYQYAIEQYTRALDLAPDEAAIYYQRGLAYRQDDQLTQALADFNRAIDINADLVDAYRERGLLFLALNAASDSATHSDAALADFAQYETLGGDMQHPELVAALQQ